MFSGETKTDVSLKRCPGYEYMYAKGKEKVGFFHPYKVDKLTKCINSVLLRTQACNFSVCIWKAYFLFGFSWSHWFTPGLNKHPSLGQHPFTEKTTAASLR